MLPIPTRSLFRSRWAALAWAAGICLGAARFAGDQRDDKRSSGNADDMSMSTSDAASVTGGGG